jgi:hypothetical protein
MSISSLNVRNSIKLEHEEETGIKKVSNKKIKKHISLQNDDFKKEICKKLNEGCVLNFIRNSSRKETVKTAFSDSSGEVKYDLCMVNKFDENLNSSLSFISEFDLEEDENEKENSFDSSDNDDSVEQIEIFEKNKKKSILDKDDDEEHNTKLEKEWNEVQKLLLHKNSL